MGETLAVASLSTLRRVDGSATYSHNGYMIIAAVNGPIEVQKKDELPGEAVVDVMVRLAAGIGGVRERHLESLIQKVLRHVIMVAAHPRTLIQIILQIVATQEDDDTSSLIHQSASMIAVVPALLQASMLALLSSSIPLTIVLTSMSIAVDRRGNLTHNPPLGATESAASFHVLAFSSSGDLILAESEGKFSVDTWENAIEMARSRCRFECMDPGAADDDVNMDSRLTLDLEGSLRIAVQNEVLKRQRWKKSLG